MSDNFDIEAIRRRAEKKLQARREFNMHLVIYILVNLGIWAVWAIIPFILDQIGIVMNDFPFSLLALPWPLAVMFGWGIGLIAHWMKVYYEAGRGVEARERFIQREIERERARLGHLDFEKPKRRARLSDDGEVVYEDDKDEDSGETNDTEAETPRTRKQSR